MTRAPKHPLAPQNLALALAAQDIADYDRWGVGESPARAAKARQAIAAFLRKMEPVSDAELAGWSYLPAIEHQLRRKPSDPLWGDLLPELARRSGLPFSSEANTGLAEAAIACFPAGSQALSNPKNWNASFIPDVARQLADNSRADLVKFGRFLASTPAPAQASGSPRPHWMSALSSSTDDAPRWAHLLDEAIAKGLFARLAKTGRLAAWAALCAIEGNLGRLRQAVEAGADLSKASPEQAGGLFAALTAARYPEADKALRERRPLERRSVWGVDAAAKAEAWGLLARAGLPPAKAPPVSWHEGWTQTHTPNDGYELLAAEAARGGFLGGAGLLRWGAAELAGSAPARAAIREGALKMAFAAGMDASAWSSALVQKLTNHCCDVGRADGLLSALREAGASLAPDPAAPWARPDRGLIGSLLGAGATARGLEDARAMGADVFEIDPLGRSPIEALFVLDRAGRAEERLSGLLAAAEKSCPGGRAKMLAQRGADGAGPMHWAARALCAQSVETLAKQGCDPMEVDRFGRTAGHWAARRYGVKAAPKVGPALQALSRAGQDWAAPDAKGGSALAALSKKGPIDPIAELLRESPDALWRKERSAKSALEVLAARPEGGGALAAAERAVLSSKASGPEGAPSAPNGRSRRL